MKSGPRERSERSKTGLTGSTGTNTAQLFGFGNSGNIAEKTTSTVFPTNETDINVLLRFRLEDIKKQIREYEKDVSEFSSQADDGLKKLV